MNIITAVIGLVGLKRAPECIKMHHFEGENAKIFLGPQTPPPLGRGIRPPQTPPPSMPLAPPSALDPPDHISGYGPAPENLLAGFERPLRDGEGKRKRDVKEIGREKGRKGEGKVGEGMRRTGQEWLGGEKENLTLYDFVPLESSAVIGLFNPVQT